VVPIDINADKFLSDEETFYVTKDQILKAISENRYPSPPARDLYFVTKGKPTDPLLVAFLNWVLTDGQKLVNTAGYIPLPKAKIDAALNSLK
jgi:phosphate transport system substrate-binding protein